MKAEPEEVLPGGLGSDGTVVRVGSTVRRPWRAESATIHAFLRHLEAVGFAGAPRHLGVDERGRAVLTFVEGEVGVPPFPSWVADDDLLASVAALQRELHDAARTFSAPPDAVWDRANLGPASPDAIVCHNDLCVENVVACRGRAASFIDFDFAAPNDPVVDIAIAARHWVPLRDPSDLDDARADVDQAARFAVFCDGHGLGDDERRRVVREAIAFLDRALVSMKARADAGRPLYVKVWEAGYPGQNRRARAWLERAGLAP